MVGGRLATRELDGPVDYYETIDIWIGLDRYIWNIKVLVDDFNSTVRSIKELGL